MFGPYNLVQAVLLSPVPRTAWRARARSVLLGHVPQVLSLETRVEARAGWWWWTSSAERSGGIPSGATAREGYPRVATRFSERRGGYYCACRSAGRGRRFYVGWSGRRHL